jgi:capsid assembly protease
MFDLRTLDGTTWAAEPTRLRLALEHLSRLTDFPNAREVARERRARLEYAASAPARAVRAVKGKVGVIPVHGPVEQRTSCGGLMLGGCSTEEIGAALDALLAARDVDGIILHVDSPGGGVGGVEEVADKLREARGKKPLYAIADSMAASAALWIGSSAETFVATPSGEVGALGVFVLHVDQSRANAKQGLDVSIIRAGKYKAEGNPFEPLSDDARAALQASVDYTYGKFTRAMAANRGVSVAHVRSKFGQGRVMNADDALAAQLIDRIMTFSQLLGKLTGGAGGGGVVARNASAEVLRLRHEQRKRQAVYLNT